MLACVCFFGASGISKSCVSSSSGMLGSSVGDEAGMNLSFSNVSNTVELFLEDLKFYRINLDTILRIKIKSLTFLVSVHHPTKLSLGDYKTSLID